MGDVAGISAEVAARREEFYRRLESGDELQGRNYLEYVDGNGVMRRCCLGVATRHAMEGGCPVRAVGLVSGATEATLFEEIDDPKSYTRWGLLPSVAAWFGLPLQPLLFDATDSGDQEYVAASANDAGVLFAEIARRFRVAYPPVEGSLR